MVENKWNFFTFSKSHAGKVRPYNEDSFLDLTERSLWVVADGMGGHSAGDVASQMLVDHIQKYAQDKQDLDIDGLRSCLESANYQIYRYAQDHLDGKTMGTTLVLLFIQDGFFHCLWVGDSRIYMLRHARLTQKTRDHSQVMDLVDQGLITKEQAEDHPLANVITRAVGVDDSVVIDQFSGQLNDGDQFLLCSDGLTKELIDAEIESTLQAASPNQAGLALMHSALVRGAGDNVTCILVKVHQEHSVQESTPNNDQTIPVFNRRGART